ncbi:MAG: trypsin-like peptidase domain-containing protein [Bacteroidota bacterium]
MTTGNKFLTALLLILIGVLIGFILMFFRQEANTPELAEIRYTEVTRSDMPLWSNDDLEKIDDRFVFRTVAREVTPTVVYIETVVPTQNRNMPETEDEDDESIWRRFMPPRAQTVGSGVLISADGYILTNNHVVQDAVRDGISVTLEDKRAYSGRVVGGDPSTDLAVVKIDAENLPQAIIGNSEALQVGDWVMAIGNPFRLQSTVTAGIVSALGREVEIINDMLRIESFIQTDAAINRGNSGGALVNTSGELIGINTAIASQNGSYQGYGFAVPSNLALKVAEDIIEFGEVRRGMLGVQILTMNPDLAQETGFDQIRGVYVADVDDEGAAGEAGLQSEDIILEVNNEPVNASNKLQEKVAMFRPGDPVTLSVWRNGELLDITAELTALERPEPEPQELSFREEQIGPDDEPLEDGENRDGSGVLRHNFEAFGLVVQGLSSPEDPEQFEFFVERVAPDSPAHRRGVPENSRIEAINDKPVMDSQTLEQAVRNAVQNQTTIELKIKTEQGSVGYYILNP